MSNYSTFFPTGDGGSSNRIYGNRRIFYGPGQCTWPVPLGTTSVQVHVWGGGGAATDSPTIAQGGGGGGGYARAEYAVTDGDELAITIGGTAGTSSITIPTQSPLSPVSAIGGQNSVSNLGAPGGYGSVSLGPTHPTSYCFTANGGAGGDSSPCIANSLNPTTYPNYSNRWTGTGGGGAAGSPQGNGGSGGNGFADAIPGASTGSGGGIGKAANGDRCGGGGSRGHLLGKNGCNSNQAGGFSQAVRAKCRDDVWWRVEEIGGVGGVAWGDLCSVNANHQVMAGGSGSGGGGGGISFRTSPTTTDYMKFTASMGGQGGFLGGGGGNMYYCQEHATFTQPCYDYVYQACPTDGRGGYAGGAGGGAEGTPGVVIIYW